MCLQIWGITSQIFRKLELPQYGGQIMCDNKYIWKLVI